MFGFVIGTICLVGLVKMARRGACGYGHGGGCGGGFSGGCGGGGGGCGGGHGWHGGWRGHHGRHHHGHGPWGHGGPWGARDEGGEGGPGFGDGRWMFQKMMLRRVFEQLDTTPGQEKVISAAVNEAREGMQKAWGSLRDSRDEMARSISGEAFDEGAMGTAFAKQDEAIAEARRSMMNALTKVHEALDAKQRAALADLLARGPRAWGRFGGPYRT